MKVDKIIKNAKIFTSDKDNILVSALFVEDEKFQCDMIKEIG